MSDASAGDWSGLYFHDLGWWKSMVTVVSPTIGSCQYPSWLSVTAPVPYLSHEKSTLIRGVPSGRASTSELPMYTSLSTTSCGANTHTQGVGLSARACGRGGRGGCWVGFDRRW